MSATSGSRLQDIPYDTYKVLLVHLMLPWASSFLETRFVFKKKSVINKYWMKGEEDRIYVNHLKARSSPKRALLFHCTSVLDVLSLHYKWLGILWIVEALMMPDVVQLLMQGHSTVQDVLHQFKARMESICTNCTFGGNSCKLKFTLKPSQRGGNLSLEAAWKACGAHVSHESLKACV